MQTNKETMKAISHDRALEFIRAGKAIMTIESKRTQKHFTFKFNTPKDLDPEKDGLKNWKDIPVWVRLLTGPNNDDRGNYTFIGTIFGKRYFHSKKTKISDEATAIKALVYWFNSVVAKKKENLELIQLYHEGRCMKCGRKLTTPDSIERGIGPVCDDAIERQKTITAKKLEYHLSLSGNKDASNQAKNDIVQMLEDYL
jgi:hypothetical protein